MKDFFPVFLMGSLFVLIYGLALLAISARVVSHDFSDYSIDEAFMKEIVARLEKKLKEDHE